MVCDKGWIARIARFSFTFNEIFNGKHRFAVSIKDF
jgi:hypothetical protein